MLERIAHPSCRDPAGERKLKLKRVFIDRAITEAIFQDIDKARSNCALHAEPTSTLIIGDTGVGKTTLLEHYRDAHPPKRVNGIIQRPVLMVELEVKANMLSASAEMLRALGDPGAERGTLYNRSYRVRVQLKLQRVEVILIDEFHHIVEASGERTLNKVGDWLKQQSKRTGIPLVLAGLPHSASVLEINHQFAGICPYRHNLDPFEWKDPNRRREFRLFLARLDAALPFNEWAGLGEIDLSRRLFLASSQGEYGNLRQLMRLLRSAGARAIDRDAPCIELQDLEAAFSAEIAPTSPLTYNPFGCTPPEESSSSVSGSHSRAKTPSVVKARKASARISDVLVAR